MEKYQRYAKNMEGWRSLSDGRIVTESKLATASPALRRYLRLDSDGAPRTKGEPMTVRTLLEEYGALLERMSIYFGLPQELIAGIICVESGRIKDSFSRDPLSIRYEPGFENLEDTPNRCSAGLMQTLLSTARDMAARQGWSPTDPLKSSRAVQFGDLMVPEVSLYLGCAYLAFQAARYKTHDAVKLSCAYNAGSLKASSRNAWGMLSYGGADRIMKQIAFQNDFVVVKGGAS